MIRVGYGCSDITPKKPVSLSGFAARCDAPFESIDDPLFVRALAVEDDEKTILLLVFDLLAIGEALHDRIVSALTSTTQRDIVPILCTTHTHSAPAAITLLGCGTVCPEYWEQVVAGSEAAARQALADRRPARVRHTTVKLPGQTYNRRRVLEDGRVSMALKPDAAIAKCGPVPEDMLLLRLEDEDGNGIAGIVHWAAHAVTVCGQNVTADFPGELCRRLSAQVGIPFLYLQGAAGNINPVFEEMTRAQMLRNVDSVMQKLADPCWPEPMPLESTGIVRQSLALSYAPLPTEDELRATRDGMAVIARTGDGPSEQIRILADILNIKPGGVLPADMGKHIASILEGWSAALLETPREEIPTSRDLALAAWRLGPLCFCFVAAEVFAETAATARDAFPERIINMVGYGSPLVGYLPTDEALDEGGYEVTYAYRFYNHPAPFAKGAEPRVVAALQEMIREL